MKTLRVRGALLFALGIAVQPGCGGRGGSQELGQGVGGIAATDCDPGNTRECVGPGACRGGQQCENDGFWGTCECAATGGASNLGTGGSPTGGEVNGGNSPIAGASAQTGTAGSTPVGGRNSGGGSVNVGGAGGSGNAGATTGSAGTSYRPTGGQGGVGGHQAGGAGGVAGSMGGVAGGGTFTGGTASGGTASGGTATGGMASGGTATGGYRTATGGAMNHPPQITSLAFYPNPITKNDTLSIYPTATDADYDRVTFSYTWMRNGQPVSYSSSSLSNYYFSKGDSITVTVTPFDGKNYGDSVTSQSIIVSNAAPIFASYISLSPTPYAELATPLQCNASATDADGDKIEYDYTWYNSGVLTTYEGATLPGTATATGGEWTCQVVATDGMAKTSSGLSEATTVGTAVSGIYRADTTWQAAKSPYHLTGRIQMAAGTTLTIEPGVTVLGNSYSLELWGSLQAVGTAEKPIKIIDLYTYDYSTAEKPSKFNLAFAEWLGGQLLGSSTSALVNISDCVLRTLESPIFLPAGLSSAHRLERNLFFASCGFYANGPVILNSNTFTTSVFGCTDVQAMDSLEASGNNFYPNTDYSVIAGAKSFDLSNSYWGGFADTEIPALIMDDNDDLSILGDVKYLPTLAKPSPTAPATDKTYFP